MSAEKIVAVAFLIVSVLNLAWQGVALLRLMASSDAQSRRAPAYRGLLRTVRCRVLVAVTYVGVGLNALWPRAEVLLVTLGVYTLIQLAWMLNSWLDIRLSKRLMALRDLSAIRPGSPQLPHGRSDPAA